MEINEAEWERDRAEVEVEMETIYPPASELDFDQIDPWETPADRLIELMATPEYEAWRSARNRPGAS